MRHSPPPPPAANTAVQGTEELSYLLRRSTRWGQGYTPANDTGSYKLV